MRAANLDNSESTSRNFSLHPLLWLAASFAVGICLARTVVVPFAGWFLAGVVAAAFVIFYLKRRQLFVCAALVYLAFILLGAVFAVVEKQSVAPNRIQRYYDAGEIKFDEPVELTGALVSEPELAPSGVFLVVDIELIYLRQTERTAAGKVQLFVPVQTETAKREYENLNLRYGARIRAATEITREDRYRNPGYVPFRQFLEQKNLDAVGTIKSPLLVERLEDKTVFLPLVWLYDWRQTLIVRFQQQFSIDTAGVLIASLLGNNRFLTKRTAEGFREGGAFHALVISGFHITVIGFVALFFTSRLTRSQPTRFAVTVVLLWAYSIVVGAEPPVVRAAIMFTIYHFAVLIDRRGNTLNALGATALALLIWKPSGLFDPSLQLTFVSVAAITAGAVPLLDKMRGIGAWQLTADTPRPPNGSRRFKTLCEILYWDELQWQHNRKRRTWSCQLFKSPVAVRFGQNGIAQTVLRFLFAAFLVSIIVQVWLLPLITVYFHRFSVAGIVLNVLIGVLLGIESLAAIFAVLLEGISGVLAAPFAGLAEVCNRAATHSVDPLLETGLTTLRLPAYDNSFFAIYFLYYVPLVALTVAVHRWNPFRSPQSTVQSPRSKAENNLSIVPHSKRVVGFELWIVDFRLVPGFGLLQAVFVALIIFHPLSAPLADGRLHVEFLDVGQGDAALITLPDGATILVDGGGRPKFGEVRVEREDGESELFEPDAASIGERVVSAFLWQRGLDSVDYLVATHADADHLDGLKDAARNFRVQTAFVGRSPMTDRRHAEFVEILNERNVPTVNLLRADCLTFDRVTIDVLHPSFSSDPNAASDNNNSLVLLITFGERRFLLTGDIEREAEAALLSGPQLLAADVIKVAHHGSKTSSTSDFVRAVNARFAVISVGRESQFGHPHNEVVERWRNSGAEVLTTGENGTISFSTDGCDLRLETFVAD